MLSSILSRMRVSSPISNIIETASGLNIYSINIIGKISITNIMKKQILKSVFNVQKRNYATINSMKIFQTDRLISTAILGTSPIHIRCDPFVQKKLMHTTNTEMQSRDVSSKKYYPRSKPDVIRQHLLSDPSVLKAMNDQTCDNTTKNKKVSKNEDAGKAIGLAMMMGVLGIILVPIGAGLCVAVMFLMLYICLGYCCWDF